MKLTVTISLLILWSLLSGGLACAQTVATQSSSMGMSADMPATSASSRVPGISVQTTDDRQVVRIGDQIEVVENRSSSAPWMQEGRWLRMTRTRNERVMIGGNADLPANQKSDSVVAIGGDATSAGEVSDSVVAIMGNTRVTGPVGNAVVTIMGNSYVNSTIDRDVVTLLGNVELGPQAVVNGKVVTLGGALTRASSAVVNQQQTIGSLPFTLNFDWFKTWMKECLFTGRLLAFDAGLLWAWSVALVSLLFYALTAALVPKTVAHCVTTLETYPGRSLLAALLSIPLTPICFLLLVITVVGILLIPFFALALLTVAWFGKLVLLAWIGKRLLTRNAAEPHWAWAVLVGGLVVTLLYTIPIIGLLSYKLLQFIGFGAVLYAMLLTFRKPAVASPGVREAASNEPAASASPAAAQENAAAALDPMQLHLLPRAGFWPRMGALLIDVILMALVTNVVTLAFWIQHSLLLVLAIYGAMMWKFKGTTIGGIVFHLQVARLDGKSLDWPTCLVRALSCFLSLAALGLGFIWIGIDRDRQAWHDKLAGTVVVQMPASRPLV